MRAGHLFALVRALAYGSVFVALLIVLLPARVLEWSSVDAPAKFGSAQLTGTVLVLLGAALALWCVMTFVFVGRGTPAPFDPPRRLVVSGPYRFVRNPMYGGAVLALVGAALFYGSLGLLAYAGSFGLLTHVFVKSYEEPALTRAFGSEYEAYRGRVRRWLPIRAGVLAADPPGD